MTPPANKVEMAQKNIAIDKVLAVPARTLRQAGRPPPAKSGKSVKPPPGR